MTRCFRFLLRFSLINLAVFAAAAAVIVGGAFVTDVPSGNTNLFSTYFDGSRPVAVHPVHDGLFHDEHPHPGPQLRGHP